MKLQSWLGHQLKQIQNLSEEKQLDLYDYKNILIDGVCNNKEDKRYLSKEEIIYIIVSKFFEEIQDYYEHNFLCPECGENQEVEVRAYNYLFNPSNLSQIVVNNGERLIELQSPIYYDTLYEKLRNISNPKKKLYEELLFSIKSMIQNGETIQISSVEIEEYFNSIPAKEYIKTLEDFKFQKASLSAFHKDYKCTCCEMIYDLDIPCDDIPEYIKKMFQ